MNTKQSYGERYIGLREGLSFQDIRIVNLMYECTRGNYQERLQQVQSKYPDSYAVGVCGAHYQTKSGCDKLNAITSLSTQTGDRENTSYGQILKFLKR